MTSGSTYSTELARPMLVSVAPGARKRARPRSESLPPIPAALPPEPSVSSTLAGLMSPCAIPASCSAWAARAAFSRARWTSARASGRAGADSEPSGKYCIA